MSNAIYQSVTDSIIAQLEKGAIPWVKPWRADSSADKNFITQKIFVKNSFKILNIIQK